MRRLALGFANSRVRWPLDLVMAGFFLLAPATALAVLGVPSDGYARALFSLFGVGFVLKGLVHRAVVRLPSGHRAPFFVANAAFEGLVMLVLGSVLIRGPSVSLVVFAVTGLFAVEALLDLVASLEARSG